MKSIIARSGFRLKRKIEIMIERHCENTGRTQIKKGKIPEWK